MDYFYAQIDETNICIGTSQLSGEVTAPNMIKLSADEMTKVLPGYKYIGGTWEALNPSFEDAPASPQAISNEELKTEIEILKELVFASMDGISENSIRQDELLTAVNTLCEKLVK